MSDMLRVAVSGLKAFQTALDTTSHNIANSTTPGYSRQRVNIVTQQPQTIGNASVGNGAQVGSIARNVDDILVDQSRYSASSVTRLETYAGKAGALNNLFADSTTGLSATLQKFTNALQSVASTPNSVSARQVLLSEAQGVSERLKSYDRRLNELDAGIDSQLRAEAASITTSAQNIARLNDQIVAASKSSGSPPNDLLDARDRELDELAKHINVNAVVQDNGAVNVSIGNGQALVTGNVAGTIVAQQDAYDPTRMTLAYKTAGSSVDLGNVLSGGSVGGLLDFRREMLDPARNELGQMTLALTSAVNAQHHEGMDLGGAFGGDLFSVGGVRVLPAQLNGGTANLSVTRTNSSAVGTSDYVLQYSNNAWNLRRTDSGAPVAMTGTGTAQDPFVADGLSISIGPGAANGDTFIVKPTAGAIDGFGVLINDPAKVAAAAPIRTSASIANTGSATISAGEVLSVANPGTLTSTSTIQFTDATHYSINGAGNFTYTAGGNIDANGWRVQISGAPKAGDSFTVGANTGGTGDNRNALELAAVLGKGVLAGGTVSLNQASSSLVGRIGVATGQAQASLDAQQIIYDDAMAQRDAVSGVNLDEEAANMLRYQQAYQAAAQVIRATQEMFDALLAATRR